MASSDWPGEESACDYASSEWLCCAGDFRGGLAQIPVSENSTPGQQISSDRHPTLFSKQNKYSKANRSKQEPNHKAEYSADKENFPVNQNETSVSYQSNNLYLMRQNHDSRSMNEEAWMTISKLRDERNALVREGEIRHKAFKEAHSNIIRISESKKKEMSMISNEELKHLIVDRILKSQRKNEASRSTLNAELNEMSKEGNSLVLKMDPKIETKQPSVKDEDDYESKSEVSGFHRVEDEEDNGRGILQELESTSKKDASTRKRGPRVVELGDIGYTRSMNKTTDRDFGATTGAKEAQEDQNSVDKQGNRTSIRTGEQYNNEYHQMMFYENSNYYANDEDSMVDPKYHDLNLEKTTELQNLNVSITSLNKNSNDFGQNKQAISKKSDKSAEFYINIDYASKEELDKPEEYDNQEDNSSFMGFSMIEGSSSKPKSDRSKLLMNDFARKMDTINKRLEALKAQNSEPLTSTDLVDRTDEIVEASDNRARASSDDHLRDLQEDHSYIGQQENNQDDQVQFDGLGKIGDENEDRQAGDDLQVECLDKLGADNNENLEEETRKLPFYETIKKPNLRSSELFINTILETYEEPSTLRGEEIVMRSQISISKRSESKRGSENKENSLISKRSSQTEGKTWSNQAVAYIKMVPLSPEFTERRIETTQPKNDYPLVEPELPKPIPNLVISLTIEHFSVRIDNPLRTQVSLCPCSEELDLGYYMNPSNTSLFNNTMCSSQFMFDNQAEIFGHEEAVEEHLFQGFLNADILMEELESQRLSVGFEKKNNSQTKLLVKKYAHESHTAKMSKRCSGSRYTVQSNKGPQNHSQIGFNDEDSMLGIKRTLRNEFEEARCDKRVSQPKSCKGQSCQKEYSCMSFPEQNTEKGILGEESRNGMTTVKEESTTGKPLRSGSSQKKETFCHIENSPLRSEVNKTNLSDKALPEGHQLGRSTSQSKSSIKKGIYKLIASSQKDADISDYLYIDKQLDESKRLIEEKIEGKPEGLPLQDELINPELIIKQFEQVVNDKFEPMRSQEYSSFCGQTTISERFQLTRRFGAPQDAQKNDKLESQSTLPMARHVLQEKQPNTQLLEEINLEMRVQELKTSILEVGIPLLTQFNSISAESAGYQTSDQKDQRRYSSSGLSKAGLHSTMERPRRRSGCSSWQSSNRRPQFSAQERHFAKVHQIALEEIGSHQQFRAICLQTSVDERHRRQARLSTGQINEEQPLEQNKSFSQNESMVSVGEYQAGFEAVQGSIGQEGSTKNVNIASELSGKVTEILLMLLKIEREARKVVSLVQICPRFNIIDFINSCFQSMGRKLEGMHETVLNKNSVYKLIKNVGSKCPLKLFEIYWGYRFGKSNITKSLFAQVFFNIELPREATLNSEEISVVDISSYSSTIKELLTLLFDLSIKGEMYFQKEKNQVTLPSIISFTKQVFPKDRESIQVAELAKFPVFADFTREELMAIGRRLYKSTKSDLITAYNLCIMVS